MGKEKNRKKEIRDESCENILTRKETRRWLNSRRNQHKLNNM